MEQQPSMVRLAESGFQSVRGLQKVLKRAGIESHVLRPPNAGQG